ncbi:hypothetical protein SAMN05216533_0161 [Streptomyces sp. Ag109_O5-10]|nr:hypothetical protein SAMN05216533_0161 [Streptomyces sp. Ag109_O5-10]
MYCASRRSVSVFTSIDSTATSAIDANNNSFSQRATSSTARTVGPTALPTDHFRATLRTTEVVRMLLRVATSQNLSQNHQT